MSKKADKSQQSSAKGSMEDRNIYSEIKRGKITLVGSMLAGANQVQERVSMGFSTKTDLHHSGILFLASRKMTLVSLAQVISHSER